MKLFRYGTSSYSARIKHWPTAAIPGAKSPVSDFECRINGRAAFLWNRTWLLTTLSQAAQNGESVNLNICPYLPAETTKADFVEASCLQVFSRGDSVETFAFDSHFMRVAISSHYGEVKMLCLQGTALDK